VGLQQGAVVMSQWQQPCVEGDAEAVRPYAVGEEVSWTGGESMRPHCTLGRASTPWLCGYARAGRAMLGARRRAFHPCQFGQWGRWREASSSTSWRGHLGWSSDGR
jgi:hypothetical protein